MPIAEAPNQVGAPSRVPVHVRLQVFIQVQVGPFQKRRVRCTQMPFLSALRQLYPWLQSPKTIALTVAPFP